MFRYPSSRPPKHELLLWLVLGAMLTLALVARGAYMEKARLDDILCSFPADGYV